MDHMGESLTLLNSRIGFLDTELALIHIPLQLYPLFSHAILQLLLHNTTADSSSETPHPARSWQSLYPFVNVSITQQECSIACPRAEADALFLPVYRLLDLTSQAEVSITDEDYSVIMISGEGLEAGQRVLDLTSPLAMAGISILFVTSYWADFILVPFKACTKVIKALEGRGFQFEADSSGHIMTNPASPVAQMGGWDGNGHPKRFSQSSFDFGHPNTPPPTTAAELQARTTKQLKANKVIPQVDKSIQLVTCAGVKDSSVTSSTANFTMGKLSLGLVKCLTSPGLKFLSFTLTDSDSASITVEKRLLHHFDDGDEDVLLGREGPEQVPITLDLRQLPFESTGIVCGVAGRLIDGMSKRMTPGTPTFNVSYLSTTRAGHAIVYEDELRDAVDCLKGFTDGAEVQE